MDDEPDGRRTILEEEYLCVKMIPNLFILKILKLFLLGQDNYTSKT
jgi:hypothetical protein